MRYANVNIAAIGYELAPNVVTAEDIETRLAPLYTTLHLKPGQLEQLTGIQESRYWDPDFKLSQGAILAGRKALNKAGVDPRQIDMLVYGAVCRENLEPATACAVADGLGIGSQAQVYDISNACLGMLNGMIQVANAIALGQIQAGLVVSCESCRQIVDSTIERMLAAGSMDVFKHCVATMTGGSGAAAVLLTNGAIGRKGHRLLGGVIRNAVQHHGLCTWGPDTGIPATAPHVMNTDSVGVLQNGVKLGRETFQDLRRELDWQADQPDKVVCHQVGAAHQSAILGAIGLPADKDFSTFRYLGNIGTVSIIVTAAIADERGFLQSGDQVGFLGIGSGLNCLMLGAEW
ncbi:MAG: 3-oxoacyl-ACP synthase III [Desulfobacterales bacterium]|nr:3-oxoacyl-ACP synthase III [Desulfobacterales bacterium]MDJ0883512.1 3-oxoacyl-ACP synthase III [Desulfobacterales bacterium]